MPLHSLSPNMATDVPAWLSSVRMGGEQEAPRAPAPMHQDLDGKSPHQQHPVSGTRAGLTGCHSACTSAAQPSSNLRGLGLFCVVHPLHGAALSA